jgi:RNA polymerase sigma factor (TIGR02999 family)
MREIAKKSVREPQLRPDMPGSSTPAHQVTALIVAWNAGDRRALQQLIPLVYDELRRVARRHMLKERAAHTLQTTALVHEMYVRLANLHGAPIQSRTHFLATCARLMRHVLVDIARSRRYQKRGGGAIHVTLDDRHHAGAEPDPDLVALDDALNRLAAQDDRKSRVVELRFFGGLSVDETAEELNISRETVIRDWKLAKVWLRRDLDPGYRHGR